MSAQQRLPQPVRPEHRDLYEAVTRLGRSALRRSPLSAEDQAEVLLRYVAVAYQRWSTYRPDAGTPGQWLHGVLRNEVRAFYREHKRLAEGDQAWAEQRDACAPESHTALVNELLSRLSPLQRRIVWLHEAEGFSFSEIAFLEGTSRARAQRIHAAAMETLRAEPERSGGAHPVLGLMAAYAAGRPPEPTPEESAQFWQRFVARSGATLDIQPRRDLLPDAEDDGPPESGVCRPAQGDEEGGAASQGNRRPPGRSLKLRTRRALRLVGPLAGLLLTVPVADATHRPHPPDDALAASPPATSAVPVAVAGTATPVFATARAREGAAGTSSLGVVASPTPEPAPGVARPRSDYTDPVDAERALWHRWRAAAAIGEVERACSALAEHARRFRQGQYAGAR